MGLWRPLVGRVNGRTRFETLIGPHLEYLYRIAYRFTGSSDRAEDLIQDLIVRLYPRTNELAAVEAPRPWLVRVMYRLFVDDLRRYARVQWVPFESDDDERNPADNLVGAGPGPEEHFDRQLSEAALLRAWGELNPDQKVLLALHDIEGYTLNELERMLDTPQGTLKSRLHRARARLRARLAAEPVDWLDRVSGKVGTP